LDLNQLSYPEGVVNQVALMAEIFLDTLDTEEIQCIRDRADNLIGLLENWALRYPFINIARIPMAVLTTATVLPRVPPSDSVLAAQMILWIFEVDDLIDKRMITLEEMQCKVEQWYSIANGSSDKPSDSDELTTMLVEIIRELSKFPLFEPLREYWASRLRIIFGVMIRECQHALDYSFLGPQGLPSLDEYLLGGIHSVGFPLWGATALILFEDPSVVDQLESVGEVVRHAGIALRLYNDIATFDKDAQEKDINSVLIVYHALLDETPNLTRERALSEAKQRILNLADSHGRRCYNLAERLGTSSGQFEETTSRLVALHAYFYGSMEHDYHTTSRTEIHKLFNIGL
jgi:hypothetical protein